MHVGYGAAFQNPNNAHSDAEVEYLKQYGADFIIVGMDQLVRMLEIAARRRSRHLAIMAGSGLFLVLAGGLIVACADTTLDELRGPATKVVDLKGRAVLPGFVDAHVHFSSFALARQQLNLDAASSLEEGLTLLREASDAARALPGFFSSRLRSFRFIEISFETPGSSMVTP